MLNFLLYSTLYWEYYIMGFILLPGLIFAIYAQSKVTSTYNKFSKVASESGRTASEVARIMLDAAGCTNTTITKIGGELTDNFNPKTNVVSLSSAVCDSTSVAAIGIAAHEVGHAIQYKTNYFPMKIRKFAIVLSNISSTLLWPLVLIGLILNFTLVSGVGMIMAWAGVAVFGLAVLVNLATLPVEYNASRRATTILKESGLLTEQESNNAKKVLSAAALTYVAALVVSILNLLRFILVIRDDR